MTHPRLLIGAVALAGLAAIAIAQLGQTWPSQEQFHRAPLNMPSTGPGAPVPQTPVIVTGRLVSWRTIDLPNESDSHMLAKIWTPSNKTLVLDLGSGINLRAQNVTLLMGQDVVARGEPGRISGKPVLMVSRLEAGRSPPARISWLPVRPPAVQIAPGELTLRDDRSYLIEGRLMDIRQVTLRDDPQPHQMAKLRTRSGEEIVVDLGTGEELAQLNLHAGDWVGVVGEGARINGRPIIAASTVAHVATIRRPAQQTGAGMGSTPGQQFRY